MSWEQLCRHGDDEATVRAALVAEFDLRWTGIARDIRAQLLAQGLDLATALSAAEKARHIFRAEQADQAPAIMGRMAVGGSPQH